MASWIKGLLVYGGLAILSYVPVQTFILNFNLFPQIINATYLPFIAGGLVVFGAYQVE